jgi:hypothetical protein
MMDAELEEWASEAIEAMRATYAARCAFRSRRLSAGDGIPLPHSAAAADRAVAPGPGRACP